VREAAHVAALARGSLPLEADSPTPPEVGVDVGGGVVAPPALLGVGVGEPAGLSTLAFALLKVEANATAAAELRVVASCSAADVADVAAIARRVAARSAASADSFLPVEAHRSRLS